MLRAEGARRWAVIGSHPLYLVTLFVPLAFTLPRAQDVGGWWSVGLLGQLLAIVAAIASGALRSEIRLTDDEIVDRRIIGSMRWSWTEVACVSTGQSGRAGVHLVVCVVGDPWPHRLRGFPVSSPYSEPLDDLVALIRSRGYAVERPDSDAHTWWYLDPRSRRTD